MASLQKRGKTYLCAVLPERQTDQGQPDHELDSDRQRKSPADRFRPTTAEEYPPSDQAPPPRYHRQVLFSLRARISERNVQKVLTYLRGTFGPISEALKINNAATFGIR